MKKSALLIGVEAQGFDTAIQPLEKQLEGKENTWEALANTHQLKVQALDQLISPWHTDLDLGRPLEVVTDLSKSRRLGFNAYQITRDSFFELFEQLRAERLIP